MQEDISKSTILHNEIRDLKLTLISYFILNRVRLATDLRFVAFV